MVTRKKASRKTAKKASKGKSGARAKSSRKAAPKSQAAASNGDERPDEVVPTPKTTLSAEDLDEFRTLLLHKRAELVGDVHNLTSEALRTDQMNTAGNLSSMPIHLADIGTDNWEQEFTLGLIENERQLLKEIDAALSRIDDKTYGVCEATHKPITKHRLRAKPWARYCIEYARAKEHGRLQ